MKKLLKIMADVNKAFVASLQYYDTRVQHHCSRLLIYAAFEISAQSMPYSCQEAQKIDNNKALTGSDGTITPLFIASTAKMS